MTDTHEFEQTRTTIEATIRNYIRAVMAQTTQPGVVSIFTRCLGLVAPQQADDAAALLPDPIHAGRNCPNEARHAVVTHDIKRTIIRFWELCKQSETTGLREYLDRLEGHATHNWKVDGTLLGTELTGYHIAYGVQAKPDPRDGVVAGDLPDTPPETGPAPAADQAAFKKEAAKFEPVPDDPEIEDPETGADPPVDPEAGLDPKGFNIDGEPTGGPPPFRREEDEV